MNTPKESHIDTPAPRLRPACVPALTNLAALLPPPPPPPRAAVRVIAAPIKAQPRPTQLTLGYEIGSQNAAVQRALAAAASIPIAVAVPAAGTFVPRNINAWIQQPSHIPPSAISSSRSSTARPPFSTSRAPASSTARRASPNQPPPASQRSTVIHRSYIPILNQPAAGAGRPPQPVSYNFRESILKPPLSSSSSSSPSTAISISTSSDTSTTASNKRRQQLVSTLTRRKESQSQAHVPSIDRQSNICLDLSIPCIPLNKAAGTNRRNSTSDNTDTAETAVKHNDHTTIVKSSISSSHNSNTRDTSIFTTSLSSSLSSHRFTPSASVAPIDPAVFLELIRTDPTRAFHTIFPDFPVTQNNNELEPPESRQSEEKEPEIEIDEYDDNIHDDNHIANIQLDHQRIVSNRLNSPFHHTQAFAVEHADPSSTQQPDEEINEEANLSISDNLNGDDKDTTDEFSSSLSPRDGRPINDNVNMTKPLTALQHRKYRLAVPQLNAVFMKVEREPTGSSSVETNTPETPPFTIAASPKSTSANSRSDGTNNHNAASASVHATPISPSDTSPLQPVSPASAGISSAVEAVSLDEDWCL